MNLKIVMSLWLASAILFVASLFYYFQPTHQVRITWHGEIITQDVRSPEDCLAAVYPYVVMVQFGHSEARGADFDWKCEKL